jgi:hypothetical protein
MTDELETWRPALIAFYRSEGWMQSAENLERGCELTPEYHRTISALKAAFIVQAVNHREAA